jgi:phosphoketolase
MKMDPRRCRIPGGKKSRLKPWAIHVRPRANSAGPGKEQRAGNSGYDLAIAGCGDVPALEALAAGSLWREHLPELKAGVVNVAGLHGEDGPEIRNWPWGWPA